MSPTRTMVNVSTVGRAEVDDASTEKQDKMKLEIGVGSSGTGAEVPWRQQRPPHPDTRDDDEKNHGSKGRAAGSWFSRVVFLSVVLLSMVMVSGLLLAYPQYQISQQDALSTVRRGLKSYQRSLRYRPLAARAITAGAIFFLADFFAQKLGSKVFSMDRLARYTSFGFFFIGPFLYFWYSMTLRYGPPDTLLGSAEKALFEQITMEPICILGYIVFDGIISRKSPQAILKRCHADFPGLWCKNAIFWVPCNFANYYLGTPDLRVIFANACAFLWNVYFSSIVNRVAPKLGKGKAKVDEVEPRKH